MRPSAPDPWRLRLAMGGLSPLPCRPAMSRVCSVSSPAPIYLLTRSSAVASTFQAVALPALEDLDVILLHPVGGHPDHPRSGRCHGADAAPQIAGVRWRGLELLLICCRARAGAFGLACPAAAGCLTLPSAPPAVGRVLASGGQSTSANRHHVPHRERSPSDQCRRILRSLSSHEIPGPRTAAPPPQHHHPAAAGAEIVVRSVTAVSSDPYGRTTAGRRFAAGPWGPSR